MGWSRQLGSVTADEVSGVAKRACEGSASLEGHEAHTLAKALAMAKAGLAELAEQGASPSADVWVGGHDRVEPDGSRHVSVSATITVVVPSPTAMSTKVSPTG